MRAIPVFIFFVWFLISRVLYSVYITKVRFFQVDLDAKKKSIPDCDYYCDMLYLLPYSTFVNLPAG